MARTRENFHRIFRGAREAIIKGDREELAMYFYSKRLEETLEAWLDPGWRGRDFVLKEFAEVPLDGTFEHIGKNYAIIDFRIGLNDDTERKYRPLPFIHQGGIWKLLPYLLLPYQLRPKHFPSPYPSMQSIDHGDLRRDIDTLDGMLNKMGTDIF